MTIYIVQHGLIDHHTHYFSETKALTSVLQEKGIEYKIYANKNCEDDIVEELSAIPSFSVRPDLTLKTDPLIQELSDYVVIGSEFSKNLIEIID